MFRALPVLCAQQFLASVFFSADLWFEGDLASILTLAAGKKTAIHPNDEQMLTTVAAGIGRRAQKKRPGPGRFFEHFRGAADDGSGGRI